MDLKRLFVLVILGLSLLWTAGCKEQTSETSSNEDNSGETAQTATPAATPAQASTPVEPCIDVGWLGTPTFLYDVPQASQTGACQFHQFSWQNFFYLMMPAASPRFEHLIPVQEVFRASGEASCEDVHPLGSRLTTVAKNDMQATNNPLIDQQGRYVHFTIRINKEECNFINQHQLYTSACYDQAVSQRLALPSGTVSTAGALEVKTAWRTLETCDLPDSPPPEACQKDNPSRYVTARATVQPLSPAHQEPVAVTLGLVGFHFIQKTPDHAEFIWASFEHVDNDPVCAGANNELCQAPDMVPAHGWSFNDPDCTDCPVNTYDPNAPDAPIQVCRAHPCGVDWSNEANAEVNAEAVQQLNDSVHETLQGSGSALVNYRLIGTLWTKHDSTIPEAPPYDFTAIQTGATLLANTTLETVGQEINCFICHNNSAVPYTPPSPGSGASTQLNFSFVFSRIQQETATCDTVAAAAPSPVAAHTQPADAD